MKNSKLRTAIFERGLTQRDLSRQTKIPEAMISLAVHGRYNLDEIQRAKISRVLRVPETELFEASGCLVPACFPNKIPRQIPDKIDGMIWKIDSH